MASRRVPRHGYTVLAAGQPAGTVTSGAPSPTLGVPIALAYLTPEAMSAGPGELAVDIRGRAVAGPANRLAFLQENPNMSVPAELRYTAEHEWVAVEGSTATVGITDFAARALGDVVFVSLPAQGLAVTAEEPCGEVESTKSVSDLYSPVDGEVSETNGDLEDDPGLVNSDPYGAGWMFRVSCPRAGASCCPARCRRPSTRN